MTDDELPPDATIEQAKAWLRERLQEGAKCPVCTQHAQTYRWSLYATAGNALVLYYRLGGVTEFVHSNELKLHGHKGQGDASRLAHWELVEEEKVRREDGGRAGYWRVTPYGSDFLHARTTIPKYAYVYDSKVQKLGGPPVSVADVMKKPFDLRDFRESA